jgi:KDO2-lipid IV(A) lauroyltransferase
MQRPRKTRKRRRPADLEHRKPFEPMPLWLRAIAALPLSVWYHIADFFAWLAERVIGYRRRIVNMQLQRCFPDKDRAWIGATRRSFYRNFADVTFEIIKAVSISKDEISKRVRLVDAGPARAALDAGQSVIVVTSHNCNWEWTLLALSIGMGHGVDAAYKPLHGRWGDRLFLTIRSRFGARMIPAKRLLMRVLRHRGQARIVAMVADQDPVSASVRHFTDFFGQDTAFYMGPEAIARVGRMAVYYLAVRRESRGHYSVTFEPLAAAGEELAEGAIIDRYARRVESLTRERPADWLWSYRRWKVRRHRANGDEPARVEVTSGSD